MTLQRVSPTAFKEDGRTPRLFRSRGGALGVDVDYAQLVTIYGAAPESAMGCYSPAECTGIRKRRVEGGPDIAQVSTSYVECPKPHDADAHARVYAIDQRILEEVQEPSSHGRALRGFYFCKIHKTLRVTPAMEAGLSDTVRDFDCIVELVDARTKAGTARTL